MVDLAKSIAAEFSWLAAEGGVRVLSRDEFADSFGNSLVTFISPKFALRVSMDRGQRFVDVGPDQEHLHNLEYVLEYSDPSYASTENDRPDSLICLSSHFRKCMDRVIDIFQDEREYSQFLQFESQKAADLKSKLFGSKP